MALDSGWAAWSKVKITCWSHLSGSEALWEMGKELPAMNNYA